VLHADYSDPDVIRVGDDYWMTSSSFNHVPALPILHSRDLVNWSLVNHAVTAQTPIEHFAQPRHGQGVWAPSIRHHAGKFWIFYPDPDFGLYMIHADDPRGTWSQPHLVKAGKGLIDPCPFWDDNGQAYLVHAWAKSRSGICNLLTLHRLAPDGTRVLDEGTVIIDANLLPGWKTLEGPKLYKRAGTYYIFAPAGGVADGYQSVFRSANIWGPYEGRVVLAQGTTPVNGPHQGGWVETTAGEHWFLHFQELPAYGRVVHLQPMRWREDGWPVMGNTAEPSAACGEPVLRHRKPALPPQPAAEPACSDDFAAPTLGLQWQWQANPSPDWASLTAEPGALRLPCMPMTQAKSHWMTPHLLMQKFCAPDFTATTRLRFKPALASDHAGLMVFGHDYAWLGLRKDRQALKLVLALCHEAHRSAEETVVATQEVTDAPIQLRVSVERGGLCRFSHSSDGDSFQPIGPAFQAKSSYWVGAKIGLFAATQPGYVPAGVASFDWFQLTR